LGMPAAPRVVSRLNEVAADHIGRWCSIRRFSVCRRCDIRVRDWKWNQRELERLEVVPTFYFRWGQDWCGTGTRIIGGVGYVFALRCTRCQF
jgi:hypothetical protein